eukprot:1343149-Amphidinium_carterae.1
MELLTMRLFATSCIASSCNNMAGSSGRNPRISHAAHHHREKHDAWSKIVLNVPLMSSTYIDITACLVCEPLLNPFQPCFCTWHKMKF